MALRFVRICAVCGHQNDSREFFCESCGNELNMQSALQQLEETPALELSPVQSSVSEPECERESRSCDLRSYESGMPQLVVDAEAVLGGFSQPERTVQIGSAELERREEAPAKPQEPASVGGDAPGSAVAAFMRMRPHMTAQSEARPEAASRRADNWQLSSEDGRARLTIMNGQSLLVGAAEQLADYLNPKMHVSSRHAYISVKDGRCFLRDISRNGTTVNGRKIARDNDTEIFPGDRICMGSCDNMPDEKSAYFKISSLV